jgi:LysR family glycine cleavage system transcriptional activator
MASDAQAVKRRRQENVLTISCNLAYGNYWLLPRLKSFHEAFPDIQVNMVTTFHGLAAFDSGIDVAIRFGRGAWPGCQSHLLFREEIMPVAAPSYTSEAPVIVKPADLLHHTLLHAKAMDRSWYDWTQWFQHFGVISGNSLAGPTFDNHLLMMQAALNGRGVALGWIGTATEFLRDGQLKTLLHTPIVLEDGLFAVIRNRRDPRVVNFLDWIIDYSHTHFESAVKQYWNLPHNQGPTSN